MKNRADGSAKIPVTKLHKPFATNCKLHKFHKRLCYNFHKLHKLSRISRIANVTIFMKVVKLHENFMKLHEGLHHKLL